MKPFSEPYTWVMNRLPPQLLMASITACCGSEGVLGGLLTGDPFQRQFPMLTTNKTLQGFTVAVYELGCAAGAVFGFFFGDKLGRRQSIILGMFVLAIGAILQFMSYGLAQMLVGRIVTGLGNGLNMATNIFGVMLAYWVDYSLRNDQTDAQWRLPLALQVAFALITVSLIVFLPESPRWLAARGRVTEARDVLWRLDGIPDEKARTISVDVQLNEILVAIESERAASKGFTTVFTMGEQRFFHRVLLGMGSQFMQQISGINLITYYAPVIFETSVGMSHDLSLLLSGLNGVAYFLSSLVPIPLIERVGRRKLLLFSVTGQAATMAILAAMTEDTGNTKKGIVAAVMLFVFNFFFVVMITPVAIDTIGYQCGMSSAPLHDVETTGQTLEDLDLLFSQETSWFIGPKSAKLAREIRYARNAQRQEQIETGAANIEKSKAGIAGMRPLDLEHVEESSDKAL
ncbi:hypothetical protein Rhopal_006471-T1 [Rhodotorula paludigena]|uniref:Major facilitator superfamily (MFS) profile domain-containing protein n=1 Tax=Rhodotorula paludigena TaxID=86838 RepID=A0AAV5GV85_9BASI|nr:hypothetical protein Rhopal_006471-T1 [Rhodotorula paludigena]